MLTICFTILLNYGLKCFELLTRFPNISIYVYTSMHTCVYMCGGGMKIPCICEYLSRNLHNLYKYTNIHCILNYNIQYLTDDSLQWGFLLREHLKEE